MELKFDMDYEWKPVKLLEKKKRRDMGKMVGWVYCDIPISLAT